VSEVDERDDLPKGWYPSPTDYSGQWMRYWTGEEWSHIPARLASRKERDAFDWPVPPPPEGMRTLDESAELYLEGLTLLGGFGFPLVQQALCDVEFDETQITIAGQGAAELETLTIDLEEVRDISVGGAGRIREGGGFIGGGFGLEGFLIGASVASILNATTTKHRIETILGIRCEEGELVFLCTTVQPSALELALSRQRATVRRSVAPAPPTGPSFAEELTRLADLVDRGFLDRSEFEKAKAKLLG
jgi:hypothetical protein